MVPNERHWAQPPVETTSHGQADVAKALEKMQGKVSHLGILTPRCFCAATPIGTGGGRAGSGGNGSGWRQPPVEVVFGSFFPDILFVDFVLDTSAIIVMFDQRMLSLPLVDSILGLLRSLGTSDLVERKTAGCYE